MLSAADGVSILNETPIYELGFRRVERRGIRVRVWGEGRGYRLIYTNEHGGEVVCPVSVPPLHRRDRNLAHQMLMHAMSDLEYAVGGGELKW